ncbi:MAG: hypothetical protein SFV51_07235, partial [Bryobacteraceae bacterium]|nr:hypothetical protein [Bryobacteraceae bacterium]
DRGRLVLRSAIVPKSGSKLYLAEGYDLWRISEETATARPVAEFMIHGQGQRFVDPGGVPQGPLVKQDAGQIVIAIGQATDLAEPGSWAKLLHGLLSYSNGFIIDAAGRKLGLCSGADQTLRVLGAAAFRHPSLVLQRLE